MDIYDEIDRRETEASKYYLFMLTFPLFQLLLLCLPLGLQNC